ncbi:MAG: hypothetical protein WB615_04130, partial [Candidatus Tumulicola sp.]
RRAYQFLAAAAQAVSRHPTVLLVLPLAVFFPLLDSRGLYEYGDANFPLNPFWIDYLLPWSGAASAGADNTFIGVPRLVYHLGINGLIATFHNLQVAQWLWYSAMSSVGLMGAWALARRLGASVYSVPLAVFYTFNLWSYDRIAQGPIYLSYQALPLVVFLLLRYLARPRLAAALYFACSLLLVIPALQISYLAALVCLGISIREVVLRGSAAVRDLGWLAVAVVATNAFYIFSMIADMWLNAGGNIALVNQRFDVSIFEHYAANVSVLNTLLLQSFYYASAARQLPIVGIGLWLIPLLSLALLLLARRPTLRSRFYSGLALALLGLWLVDGIVLAPGVYNWFRASVPGLRSFVEPDYFSPLYVLGTFVMLATGLRVGARAYGVLPKIAVWMIALSGIVPFLPIGGAASGMPRTNQPRQYRDFARERVQGNTLWIPPVRGVQYRWSPYTINGFTSLNSPSDAIGPTMAEWVSPGTARVQQRLGDAFVSGQVRTVEALAPLLGVGTVAIAADSLGQLGEWPNPELASPLNTLAALKRDGFLWARKDYRDLDVHLITETTQPPLPEVGVYDEPIVADGFDSFMWWTVLSQRRGSRYVPIASDLAQTSAGWLALRALQPLRTLVAPPLQSRTIRPRDFDTIGSCANGAKRRRTSRPPAPLSIVTQQQPRCLSLALRNVPQVAALQFAVDAWPANVVKPELAFRQDGSFHWVDPTLPAQEVPPGTHSANLVLKIPPYSRVAFSGVRMRWADRRARRPVQTIPPTCVASQIAWSERNPLSYTVRGDLRGRCTVVFRQSFAPVWTLLRESGQAKILAHLQVDGFANAWVIEASGPVAFRIVNLALFAYAGGMVLTVACVLLAIGLGVRSRVMRASRRASRVPSPA